MSQEATELRVAEASKNREPKRRPSVYRQKVHSRGNQPSLEAGQGVPK